MGNLEDTCASIRAQIAATEAQLAGLKQDLQRAENQAAANSETDPAGNGSEEQNTSASPWPLLQEEYKRYGRQMIVSQIGLPGESRGPS